MFCDVLSVEVDVHVQGMVCDFRQHEDIRVANVWVYHLKFFHEEVDEVPCPHCRVIDQLVVPRPNKDASSAVFSPMTCVSKIVAQHLNVVSHVCEELLSLIHISEPTRPY